MTSERKPERRKLRILSRDTVQPQTPEPSLPQRIAPDWETARLFLELIDRGSFRSVSQHTGQTVNAMRRRVDGFENALGVKLITRHVDGVKLTPEGENVLAVIRRMEADSSALCQAQQAHSFPEGDVRIAVEDVLHTWLEPRVREFARANPLIALHVNCLTNAADVLTAQADVAIQTTRPTAPDLRVVKLGRLHFVLFATQAYLKTFGFPNALGDLGKHRILVGPSMRLRDIPFIAMRDFKGLYNSVVKGAGIGLLPTFVTCAYPSLVPLDLGIHETADIWLTCRIDARQVPEIARMIDWSVGAFSPQRLPWFRDEFVHTTRFEALYQGGSFPDEFAHRDTNIRHGASSAAGVSRPDSHAIDRSIGRSISPARALAAFRGTK